MKTHAIIAVIALVAGGVVTTVFGTKIRSAIAAVLYAAATAVDPK